MVELKPLWNRIPPRPSDADVQATAGYAQAYADWARTRPELGFEAGSRPAGSDYPLHHGLLEASGEDLDELETRMNDTTGS